LLTRITGLDRRMIRRRRRDLETGLGERPTERVRALGCGRPEREAQDPELLPVLEVLLAPETAGNPMADAPKPNAARCVT
jgi:hypothetical protein